MYEAKFKTSNSNLNKKMLHTLTEPNHGRKYTKNQILNNFSYLILGWVQF